jgi:hypothetical protein
MPLSTVPSVAYSCLADGGTADFVLPEVRAKNTGVVADTFDAWIVTTLNPNEKL